MKNRVMKFIFAAAMTIALVSLAACGSAKVDLPGSYTATMDFTDSLNEGMAESGIAFTTPVKSQIKLDMAEDKTFTFAIDAEGFKNALKESIRADGKNMITTMLVSQGIAEEDMEQLAVEAGYENFDALAADFVAEMENEVETELGEEITEELSVNGTYEVSGDTITYTVEDDDQTIEKGVINEDGTITISVVMDEETTVDLVFTKG